MEGNSLRQEIFLTLKVMLSTKHSLFTKFPVTCEGNDLPGNFSNQVMRGSPPPEMYMCEEKVDIIINTQKYIFLREREITVV
uniref:Uncharacterized protein n=1 Tax=Prolemur simus TaxID=1328070 RepID=A0A8C8YGQ3_PROSS